MSYSIIIIVLVVAIKLVLWLLNQNKPHQSPFTSSARTLEEKLNVLRQCGLQFDPGFTPADLLKTMSRAEYEGPDWNNVLAGLGLSEEYSQHKQYCRNLLYFDTECIEDHGDYKRIAKNLVYIAQGSLPLEDIKDYVDIDEGIAWLSFRFKGKEIRINFRVDDDWVDASIFSKLNQLLTQNDPSKMFAYYSLGGQDLIIGCFTQEQYQKLWNSGISFTRR